MPILNTLGLILNMVGIALLFRFGLPQPTADEEPPGTASPAGTGADGTPAQPTADRTMARKAQRKFWSGLALVLIFDGFLLQLLAAWAPQLRALLAGG